MNLKFWLHCKCFYVSLQSHLNGLTLIEGMSEVGNCWVIPPSRNLSPYTEWWEDNAHENCAQCYLDGGRVGARDEWKIAGAEKGRDQVIPRILLILITSLTHSLYSLPRLCWALPRSALARTVTQILA